MDDIDSRPIVVGVDGSPASRAALAWAAEEAERRGCAVEAVTGTHRDFGFAVGAVPVDMMIGMLPEEMRAAQQEVLDAAVAAVSTTVEIRTSPVKEEAKLALVEASKHASMLVVGRRGMGAVLSTLLGSVSLYCVHHASCPVVVINDPAERAPEPSLRATAPLTPGPLL